MTRPLVKSLAACAAIALIAASSAQAAGTPEQRRACRKDAMKYCREFVPDVKRITACMQKNVRKLSPLCRTQFR
ncbi:MULTISPECIES: hypothetical protein [unclassified Afipia]|uniref:hypothetical protein n=1 Tax=unclassified Afipia TaxID=2642050 RepID=UPI00040DF84A|nr:MULTISPECIES: hypothetical protein [unclassified Afipia]